MDWITIEVLDKKVKGVPQRRSSLSINVYFCLVVHVICRLIELKNGGKRC